MRKAILALAALAAFALLTGGASSCGETGGGGKDTGIDKQATTTADKPEADTDWKPREFTGSGSTNIGTIKVPSQAVLEWTNEGDPNFRTILIYDDGFGINVTSSKTSGVSAMPEGTYRNITVAGDDSWTVTIRPE